METQQIDQELMNLRRQINQLDNQLLQLLEARFEISKEIGEVKKRKGLPIEDLAREKEIIESKCGKTDLDEGFVKKYFELIFEESKRLQK